MADSVWADARATPGLENVPTPRARGWYPIQEQPHSAHSGDYTDRERSEHEAAFFSLMHTTDFGDMSPTEHLEHLLSNSPAQTSII
jgi:hypothetical protein